MRIGNASTTGHLMLWLLPDSLAVESDTMSTLSVDDHSVCSVMIFQVSCSLSAQLLFVNSAVSSALSELVRSAATFQLPKLYTEWAEFTLLAIMSVELPVTLLQQSHVAIGPIAIQPVTIL